MDAAGNWPRQSTASRGPKFRAISYDNLSGRRFASHISTLARYVSDGTPLLAFKFDFSTYLCERCDLLLGIFNCDSGFLRATGHTLGTDDFDVRNAKESKNSLEVLLLEVGCFTGARGDFREPFVHSCILARLLVSSLKPIIWPFRTKSRSPSSSIAESSSDSPSKISNRNAHLGNTFDGKECVLDVAFRRAPIQSPIPGGKHDLLGA